MLLFPRYTFYFYASNMLMTDWHVKSNLTDKYQYFLIHMIYADECIRIGLSIYNHFCIEWIWKRKEDDEKRELLPPAIIELAFSRPQRDVLTTGRWKPKVAILCLIQNQFIIIFISIHTTYFYLNILFILTIEQITLSMNMTTKVKPMLHFMDKRNASFSKVHVLFLC